MSTHNEFHFSSKTYRKALLPVASAAFFLVSSGLSLSAQPVRIQDNEAQKAALQKVQPSYPAIARQLNLAGRVVVDLTVNSDGSVEKVDVVNGNPILANAAVPAAKRWKFTPFQVDGKPTEAVVRIAFDFNK
jgi:protein TonB